MSDHSDCSDGVVSKASTRAYVAERRMRPVIGIIEHITKRFKKGGPGARWQFESHFFDDDLESVRTMLEPFIRVYGPSLGLHYDYPYPYCTVHKLGKFLVELIRNDEQGTQAGEAMDKFLETTWRFPTFHAALPDFVPEPVERDFSL